MGKIKKWYRSLPIWLTFFLFALAGLAASAFFANRVTGAKYYELLHLKETAGTVISGSFVELKKGEGYIETGDTTAEDAPEVEYSLKPVENSYQYWAELETALPQNVKVAYQYTMTQAKLAPFLIYAAGLLLAALLFWFTKLRKPLLMLEAASERIAENELDFPLDYAGRDEMARLCAAFERMRSALDENNRRMLRMIDEQHRLNDAYTHDLRTPVAVLRGYTELLSRYMPAGRLPQEEVLDTVRTMSAQVERLERFVNSMSTAQRLGDVELHPEETTAEALAAGMRETAEILGEDAPVAVEVAARVPEGTLLVDAGAFHQVFENLLGNALRFARSKIRVELTSDNGKITLRVADDGPGFTERELVTAATPYYSGKKGDTEHFGLGLYICRTLCEKHGGSLTLENGSAGGCVTAAFGEIQK